MIPRFDRARAAARAAAPEETESRVRGLFARRRRAREQRERVADFYDEPPVDEPPEASALGDRIVQASAGRSYRERMERERLERLAVVEAEMAAERDAAG